MQQAGNELESFVLRDLRLSYEESFRNSESLRESYLESTTNHWNDPFVEKYRELKSDPRYLQYPRYLQQYVPHVPHVPRVPHVPHVHVPQIYLRSDTELLKYSVKLGTCPICLDKTTLVKLECNCSICLVCMYNHIESNLTHNGLICPKCKTKFNTNMLENLSNPLDLPIKEMISIKKSEIFSNIKKCRVCSSNLIPGKSNISSYYTCPQNCENRCIACDESITIAYESLTGNNNHSCSKKDILNAIQGMQPCPKCLIMVKKIEGGCNTITCGHCKTVFNYYHEHDPWNSLDFNGNSNKDDGSLLQIGLMIFIGGFCMLMNSISNHIASVSVCK